MPYRTDVEPASSLCELARTMGTDHWALLMATLMGVELPGCMLFWYEPPGGGHGWPVWGTNPAQAPAQPLLP